MVLSCQISILSTSGSPSCSNKCALKPWITLPVIPDLLLPAFSLFSGQSLAHEAIWDAVENRLTLMPISAKTFYAFRRPIPGMLSTHSGVSLRKEICAQQSPETSSSKNQIVRSLLYSIVLWCRPTKLWSDFSGFGFCSLKRPLA